MKNFTEIMEIINRTAKGLSIDYVATCSNCGKVSKRFRKSNISYACGRCCNKYNNGYFSDKFIVNFEKI